MAQPVKKGEETDGDNSKDPVPGDFEDCRAGLLPLESSQTLARTKNKPGTECESSSSHQVAR